MRIRFRVRKIRCRLRSSSRLRSRVGGGLGQVREQLVSLALFGKRGVKELNRVREAELSRWDVGEVPVSGTISRIDRSAERSPSTLPSERACVRGRNIEV